MIGGFGQPATAFGRRRAQAGGTGKPGHRTEVVAALVAAVRRLLEQRRHVLVRRDGGLAQMPRPALGLAREDGGHRPMGPPALGRGRGLDRGRADERMGEADPARILADPHQVVAFGRGEILEPVVTAARRRQQAQVPRALERRHQQETPGSRAAAG